ncbi:DUF222 domain-containing protein [Pseudarthrobacter sp. NPDC092439]|uniref:HNH endonuclease signature motif containing protein n=1 Tax=unclassified Pseudarthrobacter TaxID=2647000 RepID=UPI003816D8EF
MEAFGQALAGNGADDAGTRLGVPGRLHAVAVSDFGGADPAEPELGPDLARWVERAGVLISAATSVASASLDAVSYVEAAHTAGMVEELARRVEYLQLLAAGAVERTRTRAISVANAASAAGRPDGTARTSPADDGCRDASEFLRISLRIPRQEARRRLALACQVLPATALTGEIVPASRSHLAAALMPEVCGPEQLPSPDTADEKLPRLAAPQMSSYAGTVISATLDRLEQLTTPAVLDRIEQDLSRTAGSADPDFLVRVARRWAETVDADGTEPSEEALRQIQGAFIRKPRHGLHHIEVFATTDQFEHLLTVMNAATNPRANVEAGGAKEAMEPRSFSDGKPPGAEVRLDLRSRPQKQLDGIVAAVKAGLSTDALPATGGRRPQIMATVHYRDLFPQEPHVGAGTGAFAFTGPVAAASLRKLACDADILPVLLGSSSEVLDLGRRTRLFTTAQRTALTARDQGCTFPNCTMPAPWCEAHHVHYWSRGGATSVDNAALLCSHHHHVIHKEEWGITMRNGIPWFTPPGHIDPRRTPQRNRYFSPPPLPRST